MQEKMNNVNCPYCGEEILATAKKCKHCGEWLEKDVNENIAIEKSQPSLSSNGEADSRKWRHKLKSHSMENKFFTFIKPFLSYIDSGKLFKKPFNWLYIGLAVVNLILPFILLYKAIDSGIFDYGGAKFTFAFIFIWLFIVAACWIGFQIWWNRKEKVLESSQEGAEFPATPVISHFVQTFGEWLGVFIAVVGFGVSFFTTIFLGEESRYLSNALGLPFTMGIIGIVLFPLFGFITIVICRFIAEQCRALAAIANNTKK